MTSKQLYARLLKYVLPYWVIFTLAIVATSLYAISEASLAALMKPLLDGNFVEKDPALITLLPLILVGIFLFRGITHFVSTVGMQSIASRVVMDLRQKMFEKYLQLPAAYYDNHSKGEMISKITFDANQVTDAATKTLTTLIRDSLTIISLLAWMLYLNWKLSLIVFIVMPAIILIVWLAAKRLRILSKRMQSAMADLTQILEETVGANRIVKIFGGQQYETDRFDFRSNWVRRLAVKNVVANSINVSLVQLLVASSLAIIIYWASLESAANELTVGTFVSFFGAMAMLFSPVKRLTGVNTKLQQGLAAAESVFTLLDETPEANEGQHALPSCQGEIRFENVSFQYQSIRVLKNISVTIHAGETVALVGPSGSGKSTLVSLIPRFYAPQEGSILLDGIDLQEYELQALRQRIALVTQETQLFNDSIAANIAYGDNSDASLTEIEGAAIAAHVMEFAQPLEQGLNTDLGQNGGRVSGGQRQRIALARAFLKNAPILILDEATSALDNQSEEIIRQALEVLKVDRTTIIIAHRLQTVEQADRILVMDQGEIVQQGTHQQLMHQPGLYQTLYDTLFRAQETSSDSDILL